MRPTYRARAGRDAQLGANPAISRARCEYRLVAGISGWRRRWALAVVVAAVGVSATGCVQVRGSLALSQEDRVSGQLVVVAPGAPGLHPPHDLADKVSARPFSSDGHPASRVSFRDLSFAELERLGRELSPPGTSEALHLSRSGSQVTFDATADLTAAAGNDTAVQLELAAPGEVTGTNGRSSPGQVTWSPRPGEVSHLHATFRYARTAAWSWSTLATSTGLLALGAAALVGVLAQREHVRYRATAGRRPA